MTAFKNPATWIILLCLGGFVIGQLLTLVGLARGDRAVREEAAKWGKAISGGAQVSRETAAQLDQLHQAVEQLKSDSSREDTGPSDS